MESKLLDQEIKKRKIEVPDRDVDAAIADIMKSAKMNENEFKKAIAREGMSYSVYRQRMREDLGKMRLVNREIKSKIVIDEETLRRVYRENLDKFTDPLEVKLQQIFFPLSQEASSEEVGAARKKAEEVLDKARNGEDFAELAKKYSQGPEAAEGGVLGYFKHKELVPDLEEAGFHLQDRRNRQAGPDSGGVSHPAGPGTQRRGAKAFRRNSAQASGPDDPGRGGEKVPRLDERPEIEGLRGDQAVRHRGSDLVGISINIVSYFFA